MPGPPPVFAPGISCIISARQSVPTIGAVSIAWVFSSTCWSLVSVSTSGAPAFTTISWVEVPTWSVALISTHDFLGGSADLERGANFHGFDLENNAFADRTAKTFLRECDCVVARRQKRNIVQARLVRRRRLSDDAGLQVLDRDPRSRH